MKNLILFDNDLSTQFLPLTYTRPLCELRVGILTIREKWEKLLNCKPSFITQDYLSTKYPISISDENFVVNGSVIPNQELANRILSMNTGEVLLQDGEMIVAKLEEGQFELMMSDEENSNIAGVNYKETNVMKINHLWDIFSMNGRAIIDDFELLTFERQSQPIPSDVHVIGDPSKIFIEEGAEIEFCTLNTKSGPIYIGKNAVIMEGCFIRGPFALCEEAILKMGAKIYGPTTVGPNSKVGGEVNNCVFYGNCNKAHDGYLGNSVIGEWCNIGAGTNCSNLKNNYDEVKIWDYTKESLTGTGLQFCGLIMGDHSKCGINTMFNTGTVVGISANIFGGGFPKNFIPSFSWGGAEGFKTYELDKALDAAKRVIARRGKEMDPLDTAIFERIFNFSHKYRTWEK